MGGGMGGGMGGNSLGSGVNPLLGGNFNFNGMGNRNNQMNQMNQMPGQGSPCILVSNLDEEKVTTEALFILFGVYGNVHRVKILFNKKDNALIQMADPSQAQQAITNLDKAEVR